ncbi:MAG TPA: hypothetical protein VHK24_07640 [Steroidobacter sp.]|jgi:hypothetical protein|nr:hypothetical protein [Steroidobacter sp.]
MKKQLTGTIAALVLLLAAADASCATPERFEVMLSTGKTQLAEQRDARLFFISKTGKPQLAPDGRYIRLPNRVQLTVKNGVITGPQMNRAAADVARRAAAPQLTPPMQASRINAKDEEVIGEKVIGEK